ncbi:MAG: hypothetical protein Q9227_002416 [Pyrenula ochraceoflavens]
MNGDEASPAANTLGSFYSYKNTFDRNSVWVDIPPEGTKAYPLHMLCTKASKVTFVNIQNPYEEDLDRSSENPHDHTRLDWHHMDPGYQRVTGELASHGLEALSVAASRDAYHFVPMPGHHNTQEPLSPHYQHHYNLGSILNPSDPPIDPNLQPPPQNPNTKVEHMELPEGSIDPALTGAHSSTGPHARTDEDVARLLRHIGDLPENPT